MSSATEVLRRMLDERGVEHSDFARAYRLSTRWQDSGKRVIEHQLRKDADIGDMGIVRNLTPEQAIEATLDCIEDKSRWAELFSTPERAAETLATCCYDSTSYACDTCVFANCDGTLRNSAVFQTVSDKILEWLMGDA